MKKVYQSIVDKDKGDCWPAAIASLLNLHLEDVPHFNTWQWQAWKVYAEFLKSHGYKEVQTLWNPLRWTVDSGYSRGRLAEGFSLDNLKNYNGVDGCFCATVWSPKYHHKSLYYTHAVIIDKKYNIIHDPNPLYHGLDSYPLKNTIGFNGVLQVEVIERL